MGEITTPAFIIKELEVIEKHIDKARKESTRYDMTKELRKAMQRTEGLKAILRGKQDRRAKDEKKYRNKKQRL